MRDSFDADDCVFKTARHPARIVLRVVPMRSHPALLILGVALASLVARPGFRMPDGTALMPAFAKLGHDTIKALTAYIRAFQK